MSRISQRIYLYTSPTELRAVADRLEAKFKATRLGAELPVEYFNPHGRSHIARPSAATCAVISQRI